MKRHGEENNKMKAKHYRFYMLIVCGIIMLFLYACSPPPYDVMVVERIGVSNGVVFVRTYAIVVVKRTVTISISLVMTMVKLGKKLQHRQTACYRH